MASPHRRRRGLAAFFARINDDYRNRVRDTDYHDGEVRYDYLRLNCAKTIGAGFKYGAGYQDLDVTSAKLFSGRRVVAAANANIPTEMAMKLLKEWNARGYRLDVVWYKKYAASTYVDPHEEPRSREPRDEAGRNRQEQGADVLSGGDRSRGPECQVGQRELSPAHEVPAARDADRSIRQRIVTMDFQLRTGRRLTLAR